MKRAGFTMIELIFVIVILGILAAVALPKFAGVSDQATAQKCNAFVGTLNRTVGPSMWSASIGNAMNGDVTTFTYTSPANTTVDLEGYISIDDVPSECFGSGTTAGAAGDFTTVGPLGTPTFGTSSYYFNMSANGNLSASPRWTWVKQ